MNESRLNEDILTHKLSKQSAELLQIENILQDQQTKYDNLFIENWCFQQENKKLKDTANEIELITKSNNKNEASATSIKWRYKKTITNGNMEEYLNELHLSLLNVTSVDVNEFSIDDDIKINEYWHNKMSKMREELELEWTKKCQDLKIENDLLKKLCDEMKKYKKNKDKINKLKEMEDKAIAYDLATSPFGCNGYLAFNCFSNKC